MLDKVTIQTSSCGDTGHEGGEMSRECTPLFVSLGDGVQSSTMAFMYDRGELSRMPRAAFFGDTQNEPRKVYEWFQYLQSNIKNFPVVAASQGNLMEDSRQCGVCREEREEIHRNNHPRFRAKS